MKDHSLTRRSFAKSTTLAVGASVGLAGCMGMGGDNGGFEVWGGDNHLEEEWGEWYGDQLEDQLGVDPQLTAYAYHDAQQNYISSADTGTPQVIEGLLENIVQFIEGDLIEPIDDYLDDVDTSEFVDSTLEAFEHDGNQWALPHEANGRGLVYREDVLDEYGFSPPETFDEYIEIGKEINQGEDDMSGISLTTDADSSRGPQEFLSHYFQLEESMFVSDDDGLALAADDHEPFTKVFELYHHVYADDNPAGFPEDRGLGSAGHDDGYRAGDFAMIPIGPWIMDPDDVEGAEEVLENSAVTHLPYPEGGSQATYLEVKPVMINSHAEDKEQAMDAIEIWTSAESQEEYGQYDAGHLTTPVRTDVESSIDDERWEPWLDILETGVVVDYINWGPVNEEIVDGCQDVVYGEATPEEAGEVLYDSLQELAEEQELSEEV